MAVFGEGTDCGKWAIHKVVDIVVCNLKMWPSEETVVNESLNVLVALVENKQR